VGVESRPAAEALAGGGRTGPLAGARGGGDRRTGRRRRPEHGAELGAVAAGARAWRRHERGGGGRSTGVAVVGARARGGGGRTKGRRRPEHERGGGRDGDRARRAWRRRRALCGTAAATEREKRPGENEGARVGSAR